MSAVRSAAWTVIVTSAMASRRRRLRSTGVVVSACRKVGGEAADLLDLVAAEGRRGGTLPGGVVLLDPSHLRQRRLPAALQLAGHQPVVRIDGVVLPLRQAGLVARPLEAELPLPVDRPALRLEAVQGGDGGFQPGGADSLQEGLGDGPVDLAGEEGLAHG